MEILRTKDQKLKAAYRAIRYGDTINCNGCTIWRARCEREHKDYIYWQHYGQSAKSVSMENLRWVFRVIAKSDTYDWEIVD